jgi:hypothetical protein
MNEQQKTLVLELVEQAIDGLIYDTELVEKIERVTDGKIERIANAAWSWLQPGGSQVDPPNGSQREEAPMPDQQIPETKRKLRDDLTKEELERLEKYGSIDFKSAGATRKR